MSATTRPARQAGGAPYAALVVLLALLPGLLQPAGAAGRAGARAEASADSRTRVVTYNLRHEVPPWAVHRDLRRLARTGVGVIALQEMGGRDRRDAARAALVDCGGCHYETYMPEPGAPATTPIFWRTDRFDLVRAGSRQVTDDTWVGPRGAGPSTIKAKYVTWVLLREQRSGRLAYVLNNHLVASVQARDGGANPRTERRVRLYARHLHALGDLVGALRRTGRNVVVCGDFNVNYRRDREVRDPHFPYANMWRYGLKSSYGALSEPSRGTHTLPNGYDKRLIDYVYFGKGRALTPRKQWVLTGYHSDHRPLVVRLAVAGRGAA